MRLIHPIIANRERALTSLLQVPEVPTSDDYPDRVTLPDAILDQSRGLVLAAEEDITLRSTVFWYSKGTWDREMTTTDLGQGSSDNHISLPSSGGQWVRRMWRPSLDMHTHLARYASGITLQSDHDLDTRILPTISDVQRLRHKLGGTIGSLIASPSGLFLAVNHTLEDLSVFEKTATTEAQGKQANDILFGAAVKACFKPEVEEKHRIVLDAVAHSLQDRFVCYISNDPEAPYLQRIA